MPARDIGSPQTRTWSLVIACLPLFLALMLRLTVISRSSPRTLSMLTPDDAYYYFGVARSFASGKGSTYDGVTATNGYQPLWMLCCAVLAKAFGVTLPAPERWALLPRVALTLQMALGVAGLGLVVRSTSRFCGKGSSPLPIALAACNPWIVYSLCDGTESGLVWLAVGAALWVLVTREPFKQGRTGDQLLLGLTLAAAALARLDCALLGILCAWATLRSSAGLRGASMVIALPALALAAYAATNLRFFDTVVPVSAWLKDSFPEVSGPHLRWVLDYPVQFAIASASIAVAWLGAGEIDPEVRRTLRIGATFLGLHALHTLLFMRGDVWKWHFAAYWPLGLFVLAVVLRRWTATASLGVLLCAALAVSAVQATGEYLYFQRREQRAFMVAEYDLARRARATLAPDALIGMSDCGVFGYYRGGGVLDLDGLTLDRAYQRALLGAGLGVYLRQRGVRYLAARFEGTSAPVPGYGGFDYIQYSMRTPEHRTDPPLRLHESDEILRVRSVDAAGELRRTLVLWRL